MMMTWDAADARLATASPTNQGGEGVRGGGGEGEEEEEEEEVVVVEGQHRHVDVGHSPPRPLGVDYLYNLVFRMVFLI